MYRGARSMQPDLQEALDFHRDVVAEGGRALVGYDTAKTLANVVLLAEIPTTYDEKRPERQVNAGNLLLRSLIANLQDRIVLLRVESLSYPGRRQRSITEHKAIVRMIARGDADSARRLVEQHVMRAWRAAHAQLISGRQPAGRNAT